MSKYLVQVVVSVEVETDDADLAADYAQSLLIDDGYVVDDVMQPMVLTDSGWVEAE